jgi:hypothetical protein
MRGLYVFLPLTPLLAKDAEPVKRLEEAASRIFRNYGNAG